MPDNFDILSRAAAGDQSAEAAAAKIFRQGIESYFKNGFSLSLERCLGLPTSPLKRLAIKRNYWLRVAHHHCLGESHWKKSLQLEAEIKKVKEDHTWRKWSALSELPSGSSELRSALFQLVKVACSMKPEMPKKAIPNTARRIEDLVKYSGKEISEISKDDEGST